MPNQLPLPLHLRAPGTSGALCVEPGAVRIESFKPPGLPRRGRIRCHGHEVWTCHHDHSEPDAGRLCAWQAHGIAVDAGWLPPVSYVVP